MQQAIRHLVFCVVSLLMSSQVCAQFDTNGPNAALTIQDTVPSHADPLQHDIFVPVPGTLTFKVTTGVNPERGIILLASTVDPTSGGIWGTPWGGSIDLGVNGFPLPSGVVIVADGIGLSVNPLTDPYYTSDNGNPVTGALPTFLLAFSVGQGFNGLRQAYQCVVSDPTMPPFNLDNTEAGDVNFRVGQQFNLPLTDDEAIHIPFVTGNAFNFHGVQYADLWVMANGYISFGSASSVAGGGFTIDAVGWRDAEPAIAALMADWDPDAGAPTDGVLYEETGIAGNCRIAWGDPLANTSGGISHFGGGDLNRFQITLEMDDTLGTNPMEGGFIIDLPLLDPSTAFQLGDGLIGHTPGGTVIAGGFADEDLHQGNTSIAHAAQIEEHNATGMNASMIGYNGTGLPRSYNNVLSWNGQSIKFTPIPGGAVTGDVGYMSTPIGQAPDDVTSIEPASLDVAGGELVHVIGKFIGFNDLATGTGGTAVFDPSGMNGGPYSALIQGVRDSTGVLVNPALPNPQPGPYRDGEALVLITPNFTTQGYHDLEINFNSGASFTLQVFVGTAGIHNSTYFLGDDDFVSHTLVSNQIDFYGQSYTEFFIGSNGYITFAAGSDDFTESLPELFAGWQPSPTLFGANPGIAVMWTDLNYAGSTNTGSTYRVLEDTTTGEVRVTFLDQIYWSTQANAGTASASFNTLGTGSIVLDHTLLTVPNGVTDGIVIGVSDGDDTIGNDFTADISAIMSGAGYTTPAPNAPESIGELFSPGVAVDLGISSWLENPVGVWTVF